MRTPLLFAILIGCAISCTTAAQDTAAAKTDTVASASADTAAVPALVPLDTSVADTLAIARDLSEEHHYAAAPAAQESRQKVKLIKRNYDYRRQVFFAIGMMAFIAIMMSSSQSWNPK